jgi:pimeloyl-ACP methyl ester carboxylesterase
MTDAPVLFIHGFPFDHTMWRHQIAALAHRRCLAPDLRGAGMSVGPDAAEEYSMAGYASDLIRQLDDQRIDEVAVCGLSMGGYIAFELLRRIPQRIRAVILCNTKAAADTAEAKRGRDAMATKARSEGARSIAAELVPKLLAPATREGRPEVVREVTELIERQPVSGIVGALRALRERPDSTPLLGSIVVPVLVLAGEDDQITPAAGMREMAGAIPAAQFALIPDAGHITPLEQPVIVSSAVADFLGNLG